MFQFGDLTLTVLCTMLDKRRCLNWVLCQLFASEISSRRRTLLLFDRCRLFLFCNLSDSGLKNKCTLSQPSSVHCYVVILMIGRLPIVIVIDVLATHCRGGAGKDGRRLHLSNSCSLSVLAAP